MEERRLWSTAIALAAAIWLVHPSLSRGEDSFLDSDEYEEREAVAGVFLQEDHYRVMVEDIERNDTEFDWGWVLTPGFQEAGPPPEDTRHKALRWLPRRKGQKLVQQPHELAFDLRSYRTIHIPEVQNFAGIIKADLLAEIRGSFIEGASMFGLEVVDSREGADLELELATLDQMREQANVPVYNIQIKPFILLELRLTDIAASQELVLLRNRKHGNTVADAALNFADDFVKFLR